MQLHCPDCGATIPANDVNVQTGLAKCAGCNSVFNVNQRVATQKTEAIIPKPSSMRVEDMGRDWSIRWRWFSAGILALLLFTIAWDSFLVFWYSMALHDRKTPWIAIVFPIAHVAVGIGLTYGVLSGLLNSTTIERRGHELRIKSGPIPTFTNRLLNISDIMQLFCDRKSRNNDSRVSYTYTLYVITRDGKRAKLLSDSSESTVQYLEREIESRLGLKNVPVAGEFVGA